MSTAVRERGYRVARGGEARAGGRRRGGCDGEVVVGACGWRVKESLFTSTLIRMRSGLERAV